MMNQVLPSFLISHDHVIRRFAAQNRVDIAAVRSNAYELAKRAEEKGKGNGWIVKALRRICRREGQPSGFVSLDEYSESQAALQLADPHALPPEAVLLLAEDAALRKRHLEALGDDGRLVLSAIAEGTDGLADRLRITRRRAQQLVEDLVAVIEQAPDNDEMIAALSWFASRIREADLIQGWTQGELFGAPA